MQPRLDGLRCTDRVLLDLIHERKLGVLRVTEVTDAIGHNVSLVPCESAVRLPVHFQAVGDHFRHAAPACFVEVEPAVALGAGLACARSDLGHSGVEAFCLQVVGFTFLAPSGHVLHFQLPIDEVVPATKAVDYEVWRFQMPAVGAQEHVRQDRCRVLHPIWAEQIVAAVPRRLVELDLAMAEVRFASGPRLHGCDALSYLQITPDLLAVLHGILVPAHAY
mmetsp:Transcript_90357/g.234322  ORF Transcript_90357/g.234322 Transcript_90357/m.234322 type:complete len:221 (-) Transcript_90357:65-727(-)